MDKINISPIYNSSKLLFSIPIHEKQDIVNNQIENIMNYNPNANIIYHINKTYTEFDHQLSNYKNVYFNSKSFHYIYAKGLLWIHAQNFLEAIRLNIDFDYFIIYSSNEMFIRHGLISYIENIKNGAQIVKYDINNDWHNFNKGIENNIFMKKIFESLHLNSNDFYGGQTEGQFYQKNIFEKIVNIYLDCYGNNEIHEFETEEILPQTIFKSFKIDYGLPITLQNYSNKYEFTVKLINDIRNNTFLISGEKVKSYLQCAHYGLNDNTSIFSIKRIDRTFNNIRLYLTRQGFVLNREIFQLNTWYYSYGSKLILYDNNHIHFYKNGASFFHHFRYEDIEIGYYSLYMKIKINSKIHNYNNIGIKINNILYYYFLEELKIGVWENIRIPIHIIKKDNLLFIFDEYNDIIDIEIKNIRLENIYVCENNKENIFICLYDDQINYKECCNANFRNINEMIIKPFENIYNIYNFLFLFQKEDINNMNNQYKPYEILFFDKNISNNGMFLKQINCIEEFKKIYEIDYKFVLFFSIYSIFKKPIINFNFYINKINFISHHIPYYENLIANSYQFLSFPQKFIKYFYNLLYENINNKNICFLIYSKLKMEIDTIHFHFIDDDNYEKNINTPLIKYLYNIDNINNNQGFLFNKKYLYHIEYRNNGSLFIKNNKNEYYYYKKKGKYLEYQWLGLYINGLEEKYKKMEMAKVSFKIKLMKNFNENGDYGLKIHHPLIFYKDWINECILDTYVDINIEINIYKINQYVILNFDHCINEIEFYIKDFRIIMNYQ